MIARGWAVATLATEEFDLLVIGGGLTGAGVALDAAARGLAVGLIERRDFASAASGCSSKPLPAGRRTLHMRAVREALVERELMLELAPRLVRRLPLVVPAWGRAHPRLVGDGHRHRRLSGAEVAELVPALADRRPDGGYLIQDCQADDVRLVLTLLGEAERRGAVCANRLEAVELVEARGRVAGVEVRDTEGGGSFLVAADRVVNATGAEAPSLLGGDAPPIRPARRSHVVVRGEDLALEGAGVLMPSQSALPVMARPWLGRVLVGPVVADDRPSEGPADEDVDQLVGAVNAFFGTGLERDDLVSAFADVRALNGSRRPRLHVGRSGVLTVTGAKVTSWRQTAERAVDRLVAGEGRRAPCRTHELELAPWPDRSPLARQSSDPHPSRRHLAHRYGTAAGDVLAIAAGDPELGEPIVDGWPDLMAEAAYASVHEQARSVGDVLLRRTRLGLVAAGEVADRAVALRVANAMAPALGWSACRAAREADAWARVKDPFTARS
jgi:glycerol-3-phosphate dehydrogenase